MRQLIFIMTALLVNVTVWAQNTAISEANEFYRKGEFEKAIEAYELVINTNIESPEIFYNLGNAYYKMGKIAPAILNYERAKVMSPNDKDIEYNLNLVQKHVVDKLDVLPELFLNRWFRGIQNSFSADAWSRMSIVFFVICLLFASLYLYSNRVNLKKIGFFLGGTALVFCVIFYVFAFKQSNKLVNRNQAIIFAPSVTVKGSPDESGSELFLLHEGTKVKVIDSLGDWRNIQLSDGSEGWLEKENIGMI